MTDGYKNTHSTENAQNEEDEPSIFGSYFDRIPLETRVKKNINKKINKGFKMFGNILAKLTGAAKEVANNALSSSDKDVMEAMMAGAAIAAFADGSIDPQEEDMVIEMVKNSDQLANFGDEPLVVFNKYVEQLKKLGRMGKRTVMKEIDDVANDTNEENKIRVLLIAIEVADADDNIDDDEKAVLKEIADKLGLNLNEFI